MNHTPQIKKALQFAARKHHGQFRLEAEPLPYITHLFSVAILVAEDGADDDTVSAALLHDTLEDTKTTREELALNFNERVAQYVEEVSEVKDADGKKLDWRERKERYLAGIRAASESGLLIACADKIDNIESMLEELERTGPALFRKFGHPAAEYLWYHGEVARIAHERCPHHRLAKRLHQAYEREHGILGSL